MVECRKFPVFASGDTFNRISKSGCDVVTIVLAVPWEMVEPHAMRAYRNHNATLKRIASWGGLTAGELLAVLDDSTWNPRRDVAADHDELARRVAVWRGMPASG